MKTLLATLTIILLGISLTYGQDAAEDSIIRTLLGASPGTPLITTRTATLPTTGPLKIYFDASGDAPERDSALRNSFLRWVDDWNKDESAQHIKLEITSEPSEAYVALIQFTDFPYAMDFVSGSASGQMDVNPRTGQADNSVVVSNTLRMTMTVFTYIVVKDANALKVLYRRKDPIISKTTYLANPTRSTEATVAVRKEIEKEINKNKSKSKGDKSDKSPGLRLREEFKRMADVRTKRTKVG